MHKYIVKSVAIFNVALLLVNVLLIWHNKSGSAEPHNAKNYPLLAKRIFVDEPSDSIINFSPLRRSLQEYFNKLNMSYGFYFEYLPTGTAIKIGQEKRFVGASLIKTPLVMNMYKASELTGLDLNKKVGIKSEWLNDEFGDLYKKGPGAKISLRDAAKLTLKNSDNTASNIVVANSNHKLIANNQALNAVDADYGFDSQQHVLISPESYTSILKCLYFSCFLTKSHSQELLEYLSESPFDDRIEAGLPKSVKTAHKIGTFDQEIQSDCGIVYLPKRNYAICVMLATTQDEARKIIPEVSGRVHKFIDANR